MSSEFNSARACRRGFLKQGLAISIGSMLGAVPLGAGLTVLFSPLLRRNQNSPAVFVARLDALPANGTPCKFPVVATRIDAWSRSEGVIGAVYLRRLDRGALALNVACPHAGCSVDYSPGSSAFVCPCHNSNFGLDGAILGARSPSPRGLDTLEVEIREENQVWVRFQNFRAGEAQKRVV